MSAREETASARLAAALLAAHDADAETAERYASLLDAAGLLVSPEVAEEIRAEGYGSGYDAAVAVMRGQGHAAGCRAEYGGPGYTRCERPEGHDGAHTSALGSLRRVTWDGHRDEIAVTGGAEAGDADARR